MKPQEGIWVLIAPDGRKWEGKNPIQLAAQELNERVPPQVRAERIIKALQGAPRIILGEPCEKCGWTEYYCADCIDAE